MQQVESTSSIEGTSGDESTSNDESTSSDESTSRVARAAALRVSDSTESTAHEHKCDAETCARAPCAEYTERREVKLVPSQIHGREHDGVVAHVRKKAVGRDSDDGVEQECRR